MMAQSICLAAEIEEDDDEEEGEDDEQIISRTTH